MSEDEMLIATQMYMETTGSGEKRSSVPHAGAGPVHSIFMAVLFGLIALAVNVACAPMALASEMEKDYLIGPEDILEVAVWKDEALTKVVVVRPDGKISFPLVGEIKVGGQTVEWLQQQITSRLEGFMSEIEVSVSVNQINSIKIYLIGKVLKAGEYKIGRRINVIQALALAGGLAPFADEDDILILRSTADGQLKIGFNYKAVKQGRALEQNIALQAGDVVVVP
jgi:polysaccharide export outer membrane protein